LRLQLSVTPARWSALACGLAIAAVAACSSHVSAQVRASTTATYYRESGANLSHQAITPSVRVSGVVRDVVSLRLGWDADVVSGASVAVVDAPGGDVDAITSAT
jgi:hypothetical protein